MLSIRFNSNSEWWAPGAALDRLFEAGLEHHYIPPNLAVWRDVISANGGFDFSTENAEDVAALTQALRDTAVNELQRVGSATPASADGTYRASLLKLLSVFDSPNDPPTCHAGEACPRTGYWTTPARSNSRRHFAQGEKMPELAGDFGRTIWFWDPRHG